MKLHVKMVLREIINKGAITMDHIHSNTIEDVRIPGRHLSLEERGMIQALYINIIYLILIISISKWRFSHA